MKVVELELEHRYKNRFIGRYILTPKGRRIVGSAKEAHIQLIGENVQPIHASIQYENGHWVVEDLGSDQGTWVDQNPVVEMAVHQTTEIHISGHVLKCIPRSFERPLFVNNKPEAPLRGAVYHQVVVQRSSYIVDTQLLDRQQPFDIVWGGKRHRLPPPASAQWKETNLGPVLIQQRLVAAETLAHAPLKIDFADRSVRLALGLFVTALLTIILLIAFAPHRPNSELSVARPETNIYTKMIYDAKLMVEKKKEALKQKKTIVGQARQAPETNGAGNSEMAKIVKDSRDKGASGAAVISQIKAKQLGALIGRISKNASLDGLVRIAQNATAQTASPTKSITNGTLINSRGQPAGVGGATTGHKLGSVATSGKGGGIAQSKGVGGLTLGNVGNASVGVLVEETEVEGGLEKDVIARVIQSEIGQIRYCYERQLSANPDLFGKIQVKFTIGSNGQVTTQAIGTTTLQSPMVEGCILRRIAGWQFPKPRGGTQVLVTYPFIFRSIR
jgi:hypothetical protein